MPLSGRYVEHASPVSHAGDIIGRHSVPAVVPHARQVPRNAPVSEVASATQVEAAPLQRMVLLHGWPSATWVTQRPSERSVVLLQTAGAVHAVPVGLQGPPTVPCAKQRP